MTIAALTRDLRPVRRLRPPAQRAALWLVCVAVVGALGVSFLSTRASIDIFASRAADPKLALELAGTLATAILAGVSAFYLSLPDRPRRWILLPLPALGLWVGASGYSCWRHWLAFGPEGWQVGESAECFAWIVGGGAPLSLAMLLVLRRARPLAPVPVAAMAGLSVAATAAFLLQFFHPFDVTFLDLGLHAAGIVGVVLVAETAARRALR
jgi:hypothetical protein